MPYDATGRAITQEEKYAREKWESKTKHMRSVADVTVALLAVLFIVAGIIGIVSFVWDMWASGEALYQFLAVLISGTLIAAIGVVAVFFRFEI